LKAYNVVENIEVEMNKFIDNNNLNGNDIDIDYDDGV
jgi:hypothetical protein